MEGGVIEVTSAMHYEARQTLHVNNSVPLIFGKWHAGRRPQLRRLAQISSTLFQRNLLKYYYADFCDGAGAGWLAHGFEQFKENKLYRLKRIYADEYKRSYVLIEICWIL